MGAPMGLTEGKFPNLVLRYPKADEKPPFMTRAEIERHIAGGVHPRRLWEALYLQASEMAELLALVKARAAYTWLYPLFCFVAHTGARRSEIQCVPGGADIDFTGNTVLIREKKRSKAQRTTRRVPLTPFLKEVLQAWLAVYRRSGPVLPCRSVAHSPKRSPLTGYRKRRPKGSDQPSVRLTKRQPPAPAAVTVNEIHDHVKRVLAGTKWAKMVAGCIACGIALFRPVPAKASISGWCRNGRAT